MFGKPICSSTDLHRVSTNLEGEFRITSFNARESLGELQVIADHPLHARGRSETFRLKTEDGEPLPEDLDYGAVTGLSSEVRQKLGAARPASVGQAARISGVTPAAISLLLVHLKKRRELRRSA